MTKWLNVLKGFIASFRETQVIVITPEDDYAPWEHRYSGRYQDSLTYKNISSQNVEIKVNPDDYWHILEPGATITFNFDANINGSGLLYGDEARALCETVTGRHMDYVLVALEDYEDVLELQLDPPELFA